MSSNNLRNKLIETDIPSGYQWENIEDGIMSRLTSDESPKPNKNKKRRFVFGVLVLVGLISFITYFMYYDLTKIKSDLNNQNLETSDKSKTSVVNNENADKKVNLNDSKNGLTTVNSTINESSTEKRTNEGIGEKVATESLSTTKNTEAVDNHPLTSNVRQASPIESNDKIISAINPKSSSDQLKKSVRTLAGETLDQSSIDQKRNRIEATLSTNTAIVGQLPTTTKSNDVSSVLTNSEVLGTNELNQIVSDATEINSGESINPYLIKSISRYNARLNVDKLLFNLAPNVEGRLTTLASKPTVYLSLLFGANAFLPDYGISTVELNRKATESALINNGATLLASRKIQNVVLTTGLGYNDYRQEFNFQKSDTSLKLFKDVIVERQINPFTLDTFDIKGDTMLLAKTIRTIRHNNRLTMLNIPVYAGYSFDMGRYSINLHGGIEYHRILSHSGKYLDVDNIVDINSTNQVFKQSMWTISLAPQLSYRLNDKWHITTMMSYAKALNNLASSEAYVAKPSLIRCHLGLSYKL